MATILIVDDRPANREYLTTLLGYLGHRVLEAANGQEALALTHGERPDLMIADIVMPSMDGYELARQVRADPAIAATKIVFFTASFAVAATQPLAAAVGVNHILTKPAEPEVIVATVAAALAEAPPPAPAAVSDDFHRDHMRLLTDALARKVEDLEAEIEERKRAEAQLRLQGAALNAAANGIVITNQAGTIEWVNPAFTQLTGYAPEAAIGQSTSLLKSGVQPPEFYRQLWATIAAGEVWQGELVNRRKDGSLYTQEQTITPVRDANGHITHYIAIQQDVTARKAAEQQIRYLASVLENVSDGIVSTDAALIIRSWNAGAEAMFGYPAAEAIGRPYSAVVPYVEIDAPEAEIAQQFRQTGRWRGEVRARHKDGRDIYALVASAVLVDQEGQVTGYSSVLHDITERKQAEAALRKSEERFRRYFELGLIGMAITQPDQGILEVNGELCTILGYERAELLQKTWSELTYPDDIAADDALFQRVLDGTIDAYALEKRWIRKDGRVIDTTISVRGMRRPDGSVDYFLALLQDITQRKQHEREVEAIVAISTALRAATTQAQIMPIILEQVTALLAVEAAAIQLRDDRTGELVVALGHGSMAGLTGQRLPAGAGISGHVAATGEPYVTANVAADPYFHPLSAAVSVQAAAVVPLLTNQRALGVLWAGRATAFTPTEVQVLSAIADSAAGAIQRAGLHEVMEAQLHRLAALRQIDQAIMNSLDLQTTLVIVLSHVAGQLAVDACDILVLSRGLNMLEFSVGRGFHTAAVDQTRLRLGEGHAGKAAQERRMIFVPDLQVDPAQFRRAALLGAERFVTLFCVPLLVKGQVVGVLEVWQRSALSPNTDWLAFLEVLAGQAAIAVADARLFSDLQRSNTDMRLAYDTTLEGWSAALDLRDSETEGHSRRVTEITLRLAQALGVRGGDLEQMRRGALLHDIGKMGVPDAILRKPGPLTDEEWVIMRRHPQMAYELLAPIAFLRPALDIPYCHHEHWDGTGYPRQLQGEAIPLAARIFSVVDVWDALRFDRPYHKGWHDDDVRAHLRELAGTDFDPQVVEAFLALDLTP